MTWLPERGADDAESLLPLRWEVSGTHVRYYDFGYERLDLPLPAGLERPDCIP